MLNRRRRSRRLSMITQHACLLSLVSRHNRGLLLQWCAPCGFAYPVLRYIGTGTGLCSSTPEEDFLLLDRPGFYSLIQNALVLCTITPGQFPDTNCILTYMIQNSALSVDCTLGCVLPFLAWANINCQICLQFGTSSPQCTQCLEEGDGAPFLEAFYQCGFGSICENYIDTNNGVCDEENNTADCEFDFGDCCTNLSGDANNDLVVNVLDVVTVSTRYC